MRFYCKLMFLTAAIFAAGCKSDPSPSGNVGTIMQKTQTLEAERLPFFVYDAHSLSQPTKGYLVENRPGTTDLQAVADYALQGNDMIMGYRLIDQTYIYSSMEHFDDFQRAVDYAKAKGVDILFDAEHGAVLNASTNDRFEVGQKVTSGNVSIESMPEHYYFVTLNMTTTTPYQTGVNYGKCIAQLPLIYMSRTSLYLTGSMYVETIGPVTALARTVGVYAGIDSDDKEMLTGICNGIVSKHGGYLLPVLSMANLLPDVLRPTACSAFGVMSPMSESGKTMICRTLDWPDATKESFPPLRYLLSDDRAGLVSPLQAITKINYPDRTLYSFGMLGIIGAVTSIDVTNRNLVAILDASTGDKYAWSTDSYLFKLTKALRENTKIEPMGTYVKKYDYTFNHLFLMADQHNVGIFENNIRLKGAPGKTGVRAMRYWDSASNGALPKWKQDYLIGAVNCFLLDGQVDNSKVNPALCNAARWQQMQTQVGTILAAKGEGAKLSVSDLTTIQTAHSGTQDPAKFDNLYNYNTLQMVQYVPADNLIKVYVKPFTGKPAVNPTFFTLDLSK